MFNGELLININDCEHWIKVVGDYKNDIPLLIVHGGPGGNHYTFERNTGVHFEKYMPVIYYEQRRCGRSKEVDDLKTINLNQLIEDIEELRKRFKIAKFNILGYSFDAELALNYVSKYPGRIYKEF
ncbi:alpha/beta fold hydrolase [Macrococcus epidermidis]|uniref:alpha/beta fold hydrolase n=1 Tax=Macrococcus epidermidis TaxID=1902580 RepID=UPI0020B6DAF4|nr:alpha/beta fold hydrolase [Macrococcus epidermidis]UTH15042.1 alpha/beta fold hydrolase [Macrococcus epidermidis]